MKLSSLPCVYVSFLLRADFKTFSHLCQCHKNQSLIWNEDRPVPHLVPSSLDVPITFPFTPLGLTIKFHKHFSLIWLPLATYHLFIPDDDHYHDHYYHLQQISIGTHQGLPVEEDCFIRTWRLRAITDEAQKWDSEKPKLALWSCSWCVAWNCSKHVISWGSSFPFSKM